MNLKKIADILEKIEGILWIAFLFAAPIWCIWMVSVINSTATH